MIKCT